ncbi:S8 family peptidase [Corynebacterium dentalis]|uniref:S8 family peptidase n=1 Tax=Corynebacterium dentalis TaxID=2014528 RepID=UPI002897A981|nr:S8 family peptidase [Corynebacterium dentalis]
MAERILPHLIVSSSPRREPFTVPSTNRNKTKPVFGGDRRRHGRRLVSELGTALAQRAEDSEREGTHVTFVSSPELNLAIESLDVQRSGEQPELVAVREVSAAGGMVTEATVFIPDGKKEYFQKKLVSYLESLSEDSPKNAALVEGIQTIKRATIRELWTDQDNYFPKDPSALCWWEIWLRDRDGHERERLERFAAEHRVKISGNFLGFAGRTVVLAQTTAERLAQLFESIDDIAELRRPHEIASFLPELAASEQREWVEELLSRVTEAGDDAPVVCILDWGVQSEHLLLSHSIDASDLHTADATWSHDPVRYSHGTEMAGLALYGDLHAAILDNGPIRLGHRLESVKILPDRGSNDPMLFGAVTARGVDQPEISAAGRTRVYMLAVTARNYCADDADSDARDTMESGKPTSWSASLDALAFGRSIDDISTNFTYLDRDEPRTPRLFVVSAGNIRDVHPGDDHLDRSDAEPVEDPAHAWNALTVGAYSEHDDMSGAPPEFAGYEPIAKRGELSPASRTSVSFPRKRWPFKPDVVANGGNYVRSPDGTETDIPPNLGVLTTRHQGWNQSFFTTTGDTSAATAQVAAVAAEISAAYPQLRPETVRGLVVHSARWTVAMEQHFDPRFNKIDLGNSLRRYGMGVPSLERALYSATDALTLISETSLRPFERTGSSNAGKTREMNLHQLPWPVDQLRDLGETNVRMRVTLSYFVEPNPSNRGWSGRYAYPSHGLRFATRRPEDSFDDFRRRINIRARGDGPKPLSLSTDDRWLFGSAQQKAPGSLHTDIWTGPAVDLAEKAAIGVYPVAGWWKSRGSLDQSEQGVDYSLIVSIESPDVEVDLWTPVQQRIHSTTQITT